MTARPWAIAICVGLALVGGRPSIAQPAPELPAAAASAVVAQAEATTMVEAQLKQALDESRRQQRELVDLRLRAAAAESAAGWLPWLFLMLLILSAVTVWFVMRVRRMQQELSRRDWAVAEAELHASVNSDASLTSAPLLTGDASLVSSTVSNFSAVPARDLQVHRTAQPSYGASEGLTDLGRTGNTATLSLGADAAPRAVTVEELLDLEQQVDFFMVLGQEQAAIDLLLAHVRATGGINALPYFKLLEIYRQQGDEEAYERTRERFNQRFNAVAPRFGGDFAAGRQLEDYPAIVDRLQRAWPQPVRALAEMDSLLLRRADLEPFDLPAFHDLLTLHALVRDLPATAVLPAAVSLAPPPSATASNLAAALAERTLAVVTALPAAAAADPVDLFLPLDPEGREFTEPRPRLTEPNAARTLLADWMQTRSNVRVAERAADAGWHAEPVVRPQRLDLDLTEHAPAPREFTRPAAFMDMAGRLETRPSDLSMFDDSDLLPPSITRR